MDKNILIIEKQDELIDWLEREIQYIPTVVRADYIPSQVHEAIISCQKELTSLRSQAEQPEHKVLSPEEIISTIKIDSANLDYIAKTGTINGSLYIDIKRAMEAYHSQFSGGESDGFTTNGNRQNNMVL